MTGPDLGVVFRPQSPPEHLPDVVDAAERAGVDQLWLWEDCFFSSGPSAAAVALARTERLRVGVGLLPVPLRSSAASAMEIATLARLFPGRFVPTFGHGGQEWMGQAGVRVASPMTLLEEYTTAVRALLRGERCDVDGRYVRLRDVALDWPPSQPPPVLIGARGPRGLRLAGKVADGVLLDFGMDTDAVRDALDDVGEHAAGFEVVCYVAVPAFTTALAYWMTTTAAAYGQAGATSVVFVPPGADPDPLPLVEALGSR